MAGRFTQTVERARELLKIYHSVGRESFLEILRKQALIIVDDAGGDPKEINSRFTAIVYGFLSVIFVHDSEQIMRKQTAISENFLAEQDCIRKVDLFIKDFGRFLDQRENQGKEHVFSERLLLFLTSCSLAELKKLTVTALAERFGYHPNYLTSKFKQEKDMTIQEAMIDEKLSRAMLAFKDENERVSVKELSWDLGFADPAYFSRIFKKRFGCLPTQVVKG